jgi:hypothetical protein
MSVANANAFALLDDEGTVDAGMLAAKIVVPRKDVPSKSEDASKPGKHWVLHRVIGDGMHSVHNFIIWGLKHMPINLFKINQHFYLLEFYAGDRNGAKGGRGGSGGASATRGRSGARGAPRESGEQGALDVDSSGGSFLVKLYSLCLKLMFCYLFVMRAVIRFQTINSFSLLI